MLGQMNLTAARRLRVVLAGRPTEYNDQEISNVVLSFGKLEHVDMNMLKVRRAQLLYCDVNKTLFAVPVPNGQIAQRASSCPGQKGAVFHWCQVLVVHCAPINRITALRAALYASEQSV